MGQRIDIEPASWPEDEADARELLEEYQGVVDQPGCFERFDEELDGLAELFSPPRSAFILARVDGRAAGCAALEEVDYSFFTGIEPGACRMGRLYVRPRFRHMGLGRALVAAVISFAREAGYQRLILETLGDRMPEATALYRKLGFCEVEPYCDGVLPGELFFELEL